MASSRSNGVRAAVLLVGAALLATLPACRAKPRNYDNENDALRRQVGLLESEVARLAAERNEALAQRELAINRLSATEGEPAAAVVRAMPMPAGVGIGRLSGALAENETDWVNAVEVFVRPFDGRQRFVQVAGTLTLEVVRLGAPGDLPELLGSIVLTPDQLREAYRSSPLGTHYTVRLNLDRPVRRDALGRMAITVVLMDAISGQRHVATELTDRVYTRSRLD